MAEDLPTLPSRYGSTPARVRLVDDLTSEAVAAVEALGLRRVLVVTDPVLRTTPAATALVAGLAARLASVGVWAEATPDPDDDVVARAAIAARSAEVDGLVAFGGGSVLDAAKGAALRLHHEGPATRWRGYQVLPRPVPPIVAIPTTAGTGSEVQSFAVLTRGHDRAKVACGAAALMPRVALLDARATASAPADVTAVAGLDALGHALEAAVTTVATDASRAFAVDAFVLLWTNLPRALATPSDLAVRAAMLRGACTAGQAIEASMLGAAHAAANPLSARFGLAHGVAVATMLPAVIRANAAVPAAAATYVRLAEAVGLAPATPAALADAVAELVARVIPRQRRPAWLLGAAEVESLGVDAAAQWTGTFNPRPLDAAGFAALYRDAGLR